MNNGNIARKWASFSLAVMPADAPADQVREMRRAFYAGACAMIGILHELGGDEYSEDDAASVLTAMCDECDDFKESVKAGEA